MSNAVNLSALGSNGGTAIATWTTAGRPSSPITGQIGWNSTLSSMEVYNGSAWQTVATTGKAIAMSMIFGF